MRDIVLLALDIDRDEYTTIKELFGKALVDSNRRKELLNFLRGLVEANI